MNLHVALLRRQEDGLPIRVALVGAGKFGTMWLAQVKRTPGVHVVAVADLRPDRARAALARAGWPAERYVADGPAEAQRLGTTWVTDDAEAAIAAEVDVVVEATGSPAAGVHHALRCAALGRSVVMVNVEADALAGPLLADRVASSGGVYSLAWGDQPALVCDLVDSIRTSGFNVVAAGKGTRYLPRFHRSTPDTVWDDYGLTPDRAALGAMNPRMFNSFLDGTKSAIEAAAIANATGLAPAPDGLGFPPCGADELQRVLRPRSAGGVLHHAGQVEIVSSLTREGAPVPKDLRWGVYVVFEAGDPYVATCFPEYGVATDETGRYAALWRPYHFIGLELGVSIAQVALHGLPTGAPRAWVGDVVAVAKRDLAAGEILDGEGGYTVFGKLLPVPESLRRHALPMGLAAGVKLRNAVPADGVVAWSDVVVDEASEPVRVRRDLERRFAPSR